MNKSSLKLKIAVLTVLIGLIVFGAFGGNELYKKKYCEPDRSGNIKVTMVDKIKGKVGAELLDMNLIGNFAKEDGVTINDNRGIPVIGYHSIGEDSSGTNPLVISKDRFRKHLQTLKDKGYTTLNLNQVEDYLVNNEPIPAKSVLLTFDDGYPVAYLLQSAHR